MYFLNPISDIKIACTYSLRFASVRLVVRFNPRMANGQGCQDRTFPRVILPGNCPAAARQAARVGLGLAGTPIHNKNIKKTFKKHTDPPSGPGPGLPKHTDPPCGFRRSRLHFFRFLHDSGKMLFMQVFYIFLLFVLCFLMFFMFFYVFYVCFMCFNVFFMFCLCFAFGVF